MIIDTAKHFGGLFQPSILLFAWRIQYSLRVSSFLLPVGGLRMWLLLLNLDTYI